MNNKEFLLPIIQKYANKFNIELNLLKAIVEVESNWNEFALRFEPRYMWLYEVNITANKVGCTTDTMRYAQCCSWGLMQIMGAVAYELGFDDWPGKLQIPEINLNYGCKHLISKILKYGPDPYDIYAAYNAGSVRKISGEYINRGPVNRFKSIYNKLSS